MLYRFAEERRFMPRRASSSQYRRGWSTRRLQVRSAAWRLDRRKKLMRFPSSPHCPYVRHSTSGITVVAQDNDAQKSTYCLLMQVSAHEVKDKLRRAVDQEYNVVDMAAVLEVITSLERAPITKDTLEKTRIGKYINELRKRTNNEQLARRAKDLVKSWRQLLPTDSVNGKRVTGPTGPGPGDKIIKTVPGSPRCKTTSPSILCERSASPFCSSASSSPQSVVKLQGSNRPSTPTTPSKLNQITFHSEKVCNQNKALLSSAHSKNNSLSSQVFKPVSPAMQTAPNSNSSSGSISSADSLPQSKPQSSCTSPTHVNNTRSFCLTNTSAMGDPADSLNEQQQTFECLVLNSPSVTPRNVHSSLEIAKTNVANKRLRKSPEGGSSAKKTKSAVIDLTNDSHIQNGIDSNFEPPSIFQHSPCSSFKSLKSESETEKKKTSETTNTNPDVLKDRLTSIGLGTKLQKVKTTQQLIEELQAKKDSLGLSYQKIRDYQPETETDLFIWKKSPNQLAPTSELSRSKSELMKKFLLSSPESPSANSDHGSPVTDRVSSPCSDIVPSKSSVITSDKDFCIPYTDPIEKEINKILSQLPPIYPEVLNFEEDPLPEPTSVSDTDANNRYLQQVENVNGNYDVTGVWRSWQECVDKEVVPGETFRILPYVNIDW